MVVKVQGKKEQEQRQNNGQLRGSKDFVKEAAALDVVNVNLLGLLLIRVVLVIGVGIAEFEVGLAFLALAELFGFVDLGVLGELTVGLEGTGFVGSVLEDNIALVVLEISQGEKDDVTLVDPDLLAHLTTDLQNHVSKLLGERQKRGCFYVRFPGTRAAV